MLEKKYPKITKKDLVDGVKKWKKENEWEEEFEDEGYCDSDDNFGTVHYHKTFGRILREYLGNDYKKVKIKARKGKIVIERIEE